jgi:16S rRNA U516 pseudouridylate synthase RsuA-like enzyme
MRVRFGPFLLPSHLHRGQWRELGANEAATLLAAIKAQAA